MVLLWHLQKHTHSDGRPLLFRVLKPTLIFVLFFGTILKLLDMPEERLERMWFASGEYESVIIQLLIHW